MFWFKRFGKFPVSPVEFTHTHFFHFCLFIQFHLTTTNRGTTKELFFSRR